MSKLPVYFASLLFFLSLTSIGYQLVIRTNPITDVLETNSTPVKTTLTWFSHSPNRGCVWLVQFPPRRFCDDHQLITTNHHITLDSLDRAQPLYLYLQSSLLFKRFRLPAVSLAEDAPAPAPPNPAYGQIVFAGTSVGVPFATIIITTPAGPVSDLTDAYGFFSADLLSAYPSNTIFPTKITWQDQQTQANIIKASQHQPSPVLEL